MTEVAGGAAEAGDEEVEGGAELVSVCFEFPSGRVCHDECVRKQSHPS
eukprot:COSAG03_NODE_157_length_11420_cov_28.022083_7_plen_48_part_00